MNYGRYEILREVGRGSMGVVYEALDPHIDRINALKVLRHDRISSDKFVKRFLKEAKVVGRLSHPRIVTIYDVGEDQGTAFIAMEFIEGKSLAEHIRESRIEGRRVVELGIQIAATLGYAHKKGVIHRDVKPSNIVVRSDGQIKITDFGIAYIDEYTATLQTCTGEILGTPAYMSPEQIQGQPVDGRSDLFSLGVILYELSTGVRPFGGEGKSLATTFNEILLTTPNEPFKESQLIPKALSRIIMKALEKNPNKRFQTGGEFVQALLQCLKELDKPAEASGARFGKNAGFRVSIAATLLLIVAACALILYSQKRESAAEGPRTKPEMVKTASLPVRSVQVTEVPTSPAAGSKPLPQNPTPPPVMPPQARPAPVPPKPVTVPPKPEPVLSRPVTVPPKPAPVLSRPAPVPPKPAPMLSRPAPVKPKPAPAAPPPVAVTSVTIPRQDPVRMPVDRKPGIDVKTGAAPITPLSPLPAMKQLPKFAFLKVSSTPRGASVYINGSLKGKTPLSLKLGLGEYRVRLSRPGFDDSERTIRLEKMTDYPLTAKLEPLD